MFLDIKYQGVNLYIHARRKVCLPHCVVVVFVVISFACINVITGKRPLPGSGTLVTFTVSPTAETDRGWTTSLQKMDNNEIEVSITPPAHCIVGEWMLSISPITRGRAQSSYRHRDPIYILFNPWCKRKSCQRFIILGQVV